MRVFHSVPGVPCAKMERFAGVDTQTCGSPHPAFSKEEEGKRSAKFKSSLLERIIHSMIVL